MIPRHFNRSTHAVRYEGPIYRPPSEADSLLVQATVGCPHNRCTFCMVYKNGPAYRARDVSAIKEDLAEAGKDGAARVKTLFFPAGNTIAMRTGDLCEICRYARSVFPRLERITVYGSAQYIHRKGPDGLKRLAEAGLSRIHVGLESGDDVILKAVRKGADRRRQVEAGRWVVAAGMELSLYVMLGIGGTERSGDHARETARALNDIAPHFVRLRTFVPKENTPMLGDVRAGRFRMLGPHGVLAETAELIRGIGVDTFLASDHYTNYVNLEGRLPRDSDRLLKTIEMFMTRKESAFRPFFVGTE